MANILQDKYPYYLDKNEQTLELLIALYSDALVRYAYSYVRDLTAAEDIMEDAFAAYYVSKKDFSTKEQIRCWLYKVVRSRSVDYLRFHNRQVSLEELEAVLHTPGLEQDAVLRQRNATLYRSLQSLRWQYRAVLQLHYIEQFSIEQICTILGKSSKQVYNLLARAKSAMKELLIKEGIGYEDL